MCGGLLCEVSAGLSPLVCISFLESLAGVIGSPGQDAPIWAEVAHSLQGEQPKVFACLVEEAKSHFRRPDDVGRCD
jgi:hypothetical protein